MASGSPDLQLLRIPIPRGQAERYFWRGPKWNMGQLVARCSCHDGLRGEAPA
jgi:hypothetical protein